MKKSSLYLLETVEYLSFVKYPKQIKILGTIPGLIKGTLVLRVTLTKKGIFLKPLITKS